MRKAAVQRRSRTLAPKLMDQLKVFVGVAIFLSQMANRVPVLHPSATLLRHQQRCESPRRPDPLSIQQGKPTEGNLVWYIWFIPLGPFTLLPAGNVYVVMLVL